MIYDTEEPSREDSPQGENSPANPLGPPEYPILESLQYLNNVILNETLYLITIWTQ